jgi:hypothetical protein
MCSNPRTRRAAHRGRSQNRDLGCEVGHSRLGEVYFCVAMFAANIRVPVTVGANPQVEMPICNLSTAFHCRDRAAFPLRVPACRIDKRVVEVVIELQLGIALALLRCRSRVKGGLQQYGEDYWKEKSQPLTTNAGNHVCILSSLSFVPGCAHEHAAQGSDSRNSATGKATRLSET